MAQIEPLRQFAHGHFVAAGIPFDSQQGLMLLRRQSGRFGCIAAECQESAQQMAERRESLIVGLAQGIGCANGHGCHSSTDGKVQIIS
jgi:hypothetical protein